jgi:hypothetical protein
MFFHQLDAKLKSGFDVRRGNFTLSVSTRAQFMDSLQSIGLRGREPIVVSSLR